MWNLSRQGQAMNEWADLYGEWDAEYKPRPSKSAIWCDNCQEDFTAPCYKTKHRLYGDVIAVWRAKCPICEADCIRHITHKDEDPYYNKSAVIRSQRNEYAWEILQAGEHGFRTHYGDPFKEYNEEMERKERQIVESERSIGLHGPSLATQQRMKIFNRNL